MRALCRYGEQLEGLALSGMGHVTDQLWNTVLPRLVNARILVTFHLQCIKKEIVDLDENVNLVHNKYFHYIILHGE